MPRSRRALLPAAALLAAGFAAAPADAQVTAGGASAKARAAAPTWSPGLASARAYARRRSGVVSFAVRAPGHATGFRGTRRVRSASVVKAMLMVAYLNRSDVSRRSLNAEERAMLGAMIRRSDNVAANRVSAIVGTAGLLRLARAAKMRAFTPSPVWGGSQITAADQARFFERIDERVATRHRAYAVGLLRSIIPDQRWGIGRVRPAGWTLHLKGGWYPGVNAVDHQVALLTRGRRRVALAILISNSPSAAYAHETQRGVALRLLRGINRQPKAKAGPAGPVSRAAATSAPAALRSAFDRWLKPAGFVTFALEA